VDYKNKVHNVYLTANLMVNPKFNIFSSVGYNKAQGALDQVNMPDIQNRLYNTTIGGPDLQNNDFTFTQMNTYSDLDYELINISLGFEYRILPKVTYTADGNYINLNDNQSYVFGDQSGSFFMVRSGIKIDF